MNNPRRVYDASQQLVWAWEQQEPFGVSPANENPSGLGAFKFPLRHPGQYDDPETGIFYNYLRDCYDPATGRYCQSDPIGLRGGLNLYEYAKSSPLMYTDPTGENPLGSLAAIVGLGIAGSSIIDLGIKLLTAGNDLEANRRLSDLADQLNDICQKNPGSPACAEVSNLKQTQMKCTAATAQAQSKTVYNYLFDSVPKPPVSFPRNLRLP